MMRGWNAANLPLSGMIGGTAIVALAGAASLPAGGRATTAPSRSPVLLSEFIDAHPPYPQAHASTIVELPDRTLARSLVRRVGGEPARRPHLVRAARSEGVGDAGRGRRRGDTGRAAPAHLEPGAVPVRAVTCISSTRSAPACVTGGAWS